MNGRKEAKRDYIDDYLVRHPCVDCGETDLACLDFDHVVGSKSATVTSLLHHGYSLRRIKLEIEKCDVRCANCHRKRHRYAGQI